MSATKTFSPAAEAMFHTARYVVQESGVSVIPKKRDKRVLSALWTRGYMLASRLTDEGIMAVDEEIGLDLWNEWHAVKDEAELARNNKRANLMLMEAGEIVTIHPSYGAGELDTEPGAQPWKATFHSVSETGNVNIMECNKVREMSIDAVSIFGHPAVNRRQ